MIKHEKAKSFLCLLPFILKDFYSTYITEQEKKDELLGLYRELSIVRFYLFSETDADLGQELMNKDDALNKQIKQLEKEMK